MLAGNNLLKSTAPNSKSDEFETLKRTLHTKLIDKLDLTKVGDLEGDRFRKEIRRVVEHVGDVENTLLNRIERDRLVDEVMDDVLGLGPLELILKDPSVSDILINGPKKIYCERGGVMEKSKVEFRNNQHLLRIVDGIVS
ncbi:MAG: hypothetical protein P8M80_07110 [Pirellulaceae bacterium]|nr:hypothetical protein [Pirellulaceae bacterium]